MMLFTFLFLAFVLAGICLVMKKKSAVSVIVFGAAAAVLVCAFRTFFLYSHRVIPYSFFENYVYLVFRQSVLPVIILYSVFFLFSRDSVEFKTDMFLPLTCAFYAIYLPFCIISAAEGLYSSFSLFVKPVVFVAMLFQLNFSIRGIRKAVGGKKMPLVVLYALSAVLYLAAPAAIESCYLITTSLTAALLLSVPYCLVPAAFYGAAVFLRSGTSE